jgi:hypothetical protein
MNTISISKEPELPNPIETYTLIWCDIAIVIKWNPYCHGDLSAHLQIETENKLPIPITDTGYRSHFVGRAEVMKYG